VTQTVGCGGEQLQLAEPFVYNLRRLVLQNPVGGDHKSQAEHHAHDRSDHNKDQSLVPAFRDDDGEHGCGSGMDGSMHHGSAGVAADQGVRREVGSPHNQVKRSQTMAPNSAAMTTY